MDPRGLQQCECIVTTQSAVVNALALYNASRGLNGDDVPRRVDHAQRRETITNAVLRLAGTEGIEGVSLRRVATEAGVSMGMVQYYFPSKDEMLQAACERLLQNARAGFAEDVAADQPSSTRETLRRAMLRIVPLDEQRAAGTRIWIAFMARATVEPALATFMQQTWVDSHARFVSLFTRAVECGELPPSIDIHAEAAAALSLADGLVSHVLFGHYPNDEATAAIDTFLEHRFGPESP